MTNILPTWNQEEKLNFVIDKSLSKESREAFDNYVEYKSFHLWTLFNRNTPIKSNNITINHENSAKDPCLQAVDYLAGAGFQKYEKNKEEFYEIIKEKIKYFIKLW
jgi:hypothetical protein